MPLCKQTYPDNCTYGQTKVRLESHEKHFLLFYQIKTLLILSNSFLPMDQRIPKMVQCTPLYIPMLTGVVGAIVLRPLEPLKFDLNESGGDPEDGSVCVIL